MAQPNPPNILTKAHQSFDKMTDVQNKPRHVREVDLRKHKILSTVSVFAGLAHCFFIVGFIRLDVPLLAGLNVFSVLAWAMCFVLNRQTKHAQAILLGCAEVLIHASIATWLLGTSTGFQHHLVGIACMVVLYSQVSTYSAALISGLVFILYGALTVLAPAHTAVELPTLWLTIASLSNIFIMAFPLVMSLTWVRHITLKQELFLVAQATQDPLTQLPNRRYANEKLQQTIEDIEDNSQDAVFCVVIGDIDHFKSVNDNYGHDEGDRVLCEVAASLRASLRPQDMVGRWGGEEFCFLLPDCDQLEAQVLMDEVRRAIPMRCTVGSPPREITMSFGLACYKQGEKPEHILKRADEALYLSKERCRNRITIAGTQIPSSLSFTGSNEYQSLH